MKGFGRKIIFGVPAIILLLSTGVYLIIYPISKSILSWIPSAIIFPFSGGLIFWLYINTKESKRRKEESFRRKNK